MVLATISARDLSSLARSRLGLIVGPDVTTADPNFFFRLAEHLAKAFDVPHYGPFHEVAERALEAHSIEAVRASIVAFTQDQQSSPLLAQLSKVRWSAILSGALDWQLESRIDTENRRRPTRHDLVVVTDATHIPGTNALPVFKLLGSALRGDVVATASDFLKRLPFLADIARTFVQEYVRGSPILCAGFGGAPWLLEPLLAHLLGTRTRPNKIIFLTDDPISENRRLRDLVPPNVLVLAEGSLIDVARAVEPTARNRQLNLTLSATAEETPSAFELDTELFAAVWPGMAPSIPADERQRLLDYLFMPDIPNWDPFLHGLDFVRSLATTIEGSVNETAKSSEGHSVFLVHGRAASGKTTLLKRIALNLTADGFTCLWVREYWHADVSERFSDTFRRWNATKTERPLVLFIDDPSKLRELPIAAILDLADRFAVRVLLISSIRSSAFGLYSRTSTVGDRNSHYVTFDLSDELDEDEWRRLPDYLVEIGVYPDPGAAAQAARAAQGAAKTQDTLAVLYWLLPNTRQQIEHSIQSEYVSLGDSRGLHAIVIGTIQHSSQKIQEAYAMVAVSARYGVPLPIEILVSALGVGSYGEWLDAVNQEGPAWGLFYPYNDEDLEGSAYLPRNDVVTKTVLKIVNGGTLTHEGEVQYLRRLLAACDSTSYVYERFAERILVPYTNLRHLSFHDGLSLYTAAERALPFSSRAVTHHQGLWVRKKGGDLDGALAAYDKALKSSAGPQNPRVEQEEFVHTSRASAIIEKMEQGRLSRDEGKAMALSALEKSRSMVFINAHAVHVYAKLVSKVAFGYSGDDEVDRYDLVNKALADVDRTLTLIRSSRFRRTNAAQSVEKLRDIRDKVLARCHFSEDAADEIWTRFGSQIGFTIETRRLIAEAVAERDRGSEFRVAFEYWQSARAKIQSKLGELSPEFSEVGLHLYHLWQVHPRNHDWRRTPRDPIDWKLIVELSERVLASSRYRGDPFYRYLYGLGLAHRGDWKNANIVFDENRRLGVPGDTLHTPRSYLLHPEGNPWKLEGTVKHGASELFFNAIDLRQGFIANRTENWPRGDAVTHAYVVFSFAGPKATKSERACYDNQ